MITKIGENAGLVWGALQNGAQGIKALKKATKLKNEDLFLALGWLAREGKLTFTEAAADTIVALANHGNCYRWCLWRRRTGIARCARTAAISDFRTKTLRVGKKCGQYI